MLSRSLPAPLPTVRQRLSPFYRTFPHRPPRFAATPSLNLEVPALAKGPKYEHHHAFCLSLLPWLGPLVYRDGVTPPLNPGHPPERAGESTRAPLISPEKPALPRPAQGLRLPHLSPDYFERPGGSGDHTRAPAPARQSGPLPLHMAIFASEKSKP